jgi:hypothetical protein
MSSYGGALGRRGNLVAMHSWLLSEPELNELKNLQNSINSLIRLIPVQTNLGIFLAYIANVLNPTILAFCEA